MSCCAHRGVDPRPLGRSYTVVSVPLSHGHVYVVAPTASKPLSYVAMLIFTRSYAIIGICVVLPARTGSPTLCDKLS